MKRETLKEFKAEKFEGVSIMSIRNWFIDQHKKALYFIDQLIENGVSLEDININDWNSNYKPSVYVGHNRYTRLAKSDYKLALKHLNK